MTALAVALLLLLAIAAVWAPAIFVAAIALGIYVAAYRWWVRPV